MIPGGIVSSYPEEESRDPWETFTMIPGGIVSSWG
jgi:hypothetical protein